MIKNDSVAQIMEFESESDLDYMLLNWKEKNPSASFEKQTIESSVLTEKME